MEQASLLIYSITLFLLILLYFLNKKSKNLPPGPWNLPIVGSLPWLDPQAPHISLTELSRKFGPIYGLYLGSIYTVVVSDVKLMKTLFTKDAASGRMPLYLHEVISGGKGLITSQGDLWKDQRKFAHNVLKSFGATKYASNKRRFESEVMKSVLDFKTFVGGKGDSATIKPQEVLNHNIASISSVMIFGKTWTRDDAAWSELLFGMEEAVKATGPAGPLNFFPVLRYLPKYKRNLQAVKTLVANLPSTFESFVEKQERSADDETNLVAAFHAEQSKQKPFYTNDQLRHLVNDMFVASVETTVNSLTWFLLYAAVHQKVQAKVRKELWDVLRGQQPGLDHWTMLPYLEATIAEAARIRTVAPVALPHAATEDIDLGEYTIPKGAMMAPLLWAVHMNPTTWGDPENFRPERFLNEEGKFVKPEYFVPFHIGKRMCVGEEQARMIMFLFAANILQNFKVECEDIEGVDLNGVPGATLVPPSNNLKFIKV